MSGMKCVARTCRKCGKLRPASMFDGDGVCSLCRAAPGGVDLMVERIDDLRRRKGLSLMEFSRQVGNSPSWLANVKHGAKDIKASSVIAVCRRFGVSADWLLGLR